MPAESRPVLHGSAVSASWLWIAGTTSHAVAAHVSVNTGIHPDNHSSWPRGSHSLPVPQSKDGEA